jgi:hypothetical protein
MLVEKIDKESPAMTGDFFTGKKDKNGFYQEYLTFIYESWFETKFIYSRIILSGFMKFSPRPILNTNLESE